MQKVPAINLFQCLNPLRLAGPIFDKELRVASRRRRLYVLRFGYVALLVLLFLRLWFLMLRSGQAGGGVFQVSRLGELGKGIVLAVLWLQFLSGQILAAVLLSDAIGAEVRQRTLDVLFVTPIRSLQIVMGKLLSKLLQLVSLLAISLPVLAVVRVFGGVPWGSVIAGLCVTLSASLFGGALSLLLSISSRHFYHAVLTVGLSFIVIWGLVPLVLGHLASAQCIAGTTVTFLLGLTNPFVVMADLTRGILTGVGGMGLSAAWPRHCLFLLGSAGILLAWSVWRVRRIALRVAPLRVPETTTEAGARHWGAPRAIRPVTGSPIVWKERCRPLFQTRRHGIVLICVLAVALACLLILVIRAGGPVHVVLFPLAQILQLLFVLGLAGGAAGSITKEREARTWPILLATPLDDGEIVKGKALGVFLRNLPLLLPLPVLYWLPFVLGPSNQRTAPEFVLWAVLLACGLAGTTLFLLGTGLYFSTRLKTTTAAVVATLAVYYLPKLFFCGFLSPLFVVSAGMLAVVGGGSSGPAAPAILLIGIAPAAVYVGVGLFFMRRATARVRREVF